MIRTSLERQPALGREHRDRGQDRARRSGVHTSAERRADADARPEAVARSAPPLPASRTTGAKARPSSSPSCGTSRPTPDHREQRDRQVAQEVLRQPERREQPRGGEGEHGERRGQADRHAERAAPAALGRHRGDHRQHRQDARRQARSRGPPRPRPRSARDPSPSEPTTARAERIEQDAELRPAGGARTIRHDGRMLVDLPLEELAAYRPEPLRRPTSTRSGRSTLAEARGHAARGALRAGRRRAARRSRRFDVTFSGYGGQPIKGWLHAAARRRRAAAVRGRVHRLRRRARLPARLAALVARRLRAPGHGHARPGQRLARGDTPDPARAAATRPPRLHDPRHRPTRDTTTTGGCSPTRCARSRRRAAHPAVDAEPRRRHAAAARAAGSRSPSPGWCRTCVAAHARRAVPLPLPARDRDHRRAPVQPRSRATCACTATRSTQRLRHAGVLRRRQLRGPRRRRRRCSRSR